MTTNACVDEEAALTSFRDLAEDRFSFLVPLGFRLTSTTDSSVQFESPAGVFVHVTHAWDDKFVGFRVGTMDRPRDAITDYELGLVEGARSEGRGADPIAESPEAADDVLGQLADQLQRWGTRALAGDPAVFDEVNEHRRRYTEKFT